MARNSNHINLLYPEIRIDRDKIFRIVLREVRIDRRTEGAILVDIRRSTDQNHEQRAERIVWCILSFGSPSDAHLFILVLALNLFELLQIRQILETP